MPKNVLFVVDRSGNMKCLPETNSVDCEINVPATALPGSKWFGITGALRTTFGELSSSSSTSAGLLLFSDDDVCAVNSTPDVGVGLLTQTQLDALDAVLSATTPNGGTPLVAATVAAYQNIQQAPQSRFVVVISDGMDSCLSRYVGLGSDPVGYLLSTVMPAAQSSSIRTFVVGVPGSEPARGLLSRMASLGGTARTDTCDDSMAANDVGDCHLDLTGSTDFEADLESALGQVTSQITGACEFALPAGESVEPDKVNVSFFRGGTQEIELVRDDTAECGGGAEGWQYSPDEAGTQEKTKLVVCGSACEEVRTDPNGRMDVVLGCQTRALVR